MIVEVFSNSNASKILRFYENITENQILRIKMEKKKEKIEKEMRKKSISGSWF